MQVQDDDKTIVGGFNLELTYSVQVDNGTKYLVIKDLSIGRSDSCDIKIDDKKISRMHAKFEIINKDLIITDLNSSNGTFVNGKRIVGAAKLANGDKVKLENHELIISVGVSLPNKENANDKTKIVDSIEDGLSTKSEIKQSSEVEVKQGAEILKKDEPEVKVQQEAKIKETEIKETEIKEAEIKETEKKEVKIKETEKKEVKIKEVINQSKEEIPSSWVEETGSVDGTRMMDPKEIEAIKAGIPREATPVKSTMTCLHCFSENAAEQIFELPVNDFEEASGWEIGRDAKCDIFIEHSSVSNRHAQIIHQRGRWKIVNLVSTNGIVINGQKKLSAYLGDGDKIGLGSVDLIFKTPKSSLAKKINKKNDSTQGKNILIPVAMAFVLIGLIVAIYLNM